MQIQEVEQQVGIKKKNIRFYEEQGLLVPARANNGYRQYSQQDIVRLKQIKALRKLSVPIEQIQEVFGGVCSLEDCLKKHQKQIAQTQTDLSKMDAVIKEALNNPAPLTLETWDVDQSLASMEQMEQEGASFADVEWTDVHRKKTIGSIIGASIMIILMGLFGVMIVWGNTQDPLPPTLFFIMLGIPFLVMIGTVVVLLQRIKEIQGGEEDEATYY